MERYNLPPLPEVHVACNLTLLLTRPPRDDEVLRVAPNPGPDMPVNTVWLVPNSGDLPARRLMNGIDTLRTSVTTNGRNLQRLVLGTDLRECAPHGLFDNMTPDQTARLRSLKDRLTKSQQLALEYVMDRKDNIALVTGPPGTGKSYFAAIATLVCRIVELKVLVIAPSNTAVDSIAERIQGLAPEEHAMRYHSANFEERVMLRQAHRSGMNAGLAIDVPDNENVDPANDDPVPEEDSKSTLSDADISLQQLLYRLRKDAASQRKGKRQNFKMMSAYQRCLERAGMINDETSGKPEIGHPSDPDKADTHAEFREPFF